MDECTTRRGGILRGKKWWLRVVLPCCLLLICGLVVWLMRKPAPARSAPMQARLELAAGQVTTIKNGIESPSYSGVALLPDTIIRTSAGSRALVRLSDGSAIFMRGGSSAQLGLGTVDLLAGEIWVDAPPVERNAVLHRAGDISVFAVDAGLSFKKEDAGAVIYVARGLATVTAPGGRAEVQAGEQAQVAAGKAPVVTPVAFWEDWTGGMADHGVVGSMAGLGAGSIFGIDTMAPSGTAAKALEVSRQSVRATLRSGLAETEVDQTFFNPGDRPVEGWYWFAVPEDAQVTGFALETNGNLVEGELIEKREAAAKYDRAVATGHEPALLEWVDAHTFRARIYPVPATGTRRVVLRYLQMLPQSAGTIRYLYPLQTPKPIRIGEFSLTVDLGEEGRNMEITTLADARVEQGGRLVTMRRSGYTPRADFLLEARGRSQLAPLRVSRMVVGGDSADYVMVRYLPDLDWGKVKSSRGQVVLVVDTSAGGDDSSRALKLNAAESILRALSSDDSFALMALDVRPAVLHPKQGLAPAGNQEISAALEKLAEHSSGGATDMASFFDVALSLLHGSDQPAVIYIGDGIATSGELDGEQLSEHLRRSLSTSKARLFTVGIGPYANRSLLSLLARVGGGQVFQIDQADSASERALRLVAALKTPTVTDFELDLGAGLDEVFESHNGKVVNGEEVVVLARTHHELPSAIKIKGRLGGESISREYAIAPDVGVSAAFIPKLWASSYLRRLLGTATDPDAVRGKVMQLGLDYGLMTPYTSFLALESEDAYRQQGIRRRVSPLRGVKLSVLQQEQQEYLTRAVQVVADSVGFGCNMQSDKGEAVYQAPTAVPPQVENSKGPSAGQTAEVEAKMASSARGARSKVKSMDTRDAPTDVAIAQERPPAPGMMAPGVDNRKVDAMEGERGKLGGATGMPAVFDGRMQQSLQVCSDAAARPLRERVILWRKRLRTAASVQELVGRYITAKQSCELLDWHSEATFLEVMLPAINSEGAASYVLSFFRNEPDLQLYLARLILRRTVDPRIIAVVEGVLFGNKINWANVDGELTAIKDPAKRLEKLRQILVRSPNDPNGLIRLVRLLLHSGSQEEALMQGRRLRDAGLTTPYIDRELGDVLAKQQLDDEAVRTYSEIVEFDPESLGSRQLLGDIFLAHGWYGPAYRQYKLLTETAPNEALFWLRLASAAAGAGRVDEALRLERQVASTPGRPGASDPRRFAELWYAARLSRLLAMKSQDGAAANKGMIDGFKGKLKELQLFKGPAALVLLTWEDLSAQITLGSLKGKTQVAVGQATDGSAVGLSAILLAPKDFDEVQFVAFLKSPLRDRPVALKRQDITWDGKEFKISVKDIQLPIGSAQIEL